MKPSTGLIILAEWISAGSRLPRRSLCWAKITYLYKYLVA